MKIKVFKIRMADEHLTIDENRVNKFLTRVEMKKSSSTLVTGAENFWSLLVHYTEKSNDYNEPLTNHEEQSQKADNKTESDLTENEVSIVENLKYWRIQRSKEESLPPYMILSNQDILQVAKIKPQTLEDLIEIKGFGDRKVEKYGDDVLSILGAL